MAGLVLGLDPGSIVTGYALMRSPTELVECGALKATRTRSVMTRIDNMTCDVVELLAERQPTAVVIEVPTPHVHAGRPGAGLTVYGMAVGAIYATVRAVVGVPTYGTPTCSVWTYTDQAWTKGTPKRDRQRMIAATLPAYQAADDPGADIADAIGLCLFWFERRRLRALTGEGG